MGTARWTPGVDARAAAKTTTFVAALRVGETAAPCVFDGPMGRVVRWRNQRIGGLRMATACATLENAAALGAGVEVNLCQHEHTPITYGEMILRKQEGSVDLCRMS